MHPADRVAAGGPRAHRRDLQSGPPRQLRGGRDPRRPAHRLRPAHGHRSRPTAPSRRKTPSPTRRPWPRTHFQYFVDFGKVPTMRRRGRGGRRPATAPTSRQRLARPIDDFGLSVRSLNSLKNSNIRTLKDLVEFSEDDLLKVKNVGEKALQRDRRAARAGGAQLRHGVRGDRRRAARAPLGHPADGPSVAPARGELQ